MGLTDLVFKSRNFFIFTGTMRVRDCFLILISVELIVREKKDIQQHDFPKF